jgi:hypothetical protein
MVSNNVNLSGPQSIKSAAPVDKASASSASSAISMFKDLGNIALRPATETSNAAKEAAVLFS